ncbi:MAG: hypothetical protein V1709_00770 [Planctomycetota bacterium]
MTEVKTETKTSEPMVKVEFLGEAYSGREIKRARKGQSFDIPESSAKKLVSSFPGEWRIVKKATEAPAPDNKVKKIIEPIKPVAPAMTKANSFQPPVKKIEVKPEMKKEAVVAPKPVIEPPKPAPIAATPKPASVPAPKKPLPPAPKLSMDGKKVTRKKQK